MRRFQLALPHYSDSPSEAFQRRDVPFVTGSIRFKLGLPKIGVRLRRRCVTTPFVPMPEAAIDKNCRSAPRKNNVWFAGQASVVQAVSVAQCVQHFSKLELRPSVLRSHRSHDCTARSSVYVVGHSRQFRLRLCHVKKCCTLIQQLFAQSRCENRKAQ